MLIKTPLKYLFARGWTQNTNSFRRLACEGKTVTHTRTHARMHTHTLTSSILNLFWKQKQCLMQEWRKYVLKRNPQCGQFLGDSCQNSPLICTNCSTIIVTWVSVWVSCRPLMVDFEYIIWYSSNFTFLILLENVVFDQKNLSPCICNDNLSPNAPSHNTPSWFKYWDKVGIECQLNRCFNCKHTCCFGK